MADPEVTAPAATTDVQPVVPAEAAIPEEKPLTRTEVAELIASAQKDVESRLRQDIESLSASTRKTAGNYGAANAKLLKMEQTLEAVATRNMDENEARLWKAERAVERANETTQVVNQQQEYEQAQTVFRQRSTAFLASEGIKPDDERLTTSFAKYVAESKTYADWDNALIRAVADVHKSEAKRIADEAKTSVEKAREEERAKLRNETRSGDGKIDKGSPAAQGKVDWNSLSPEEFAANDPFSAEAIARRRRQLR